MLYRLRHDSGLVNLSIQQILRLIDVSMAAPADSSSSSSRNASSDSAAEGAASPEDPSSLGEEAGDPSDDSGEVSGDHLSEVTISIHFATSRRGQLRARLLRTQEGDDETDLSELMGGFEPEEIVVRGQIQARLDLNALFAEGLFADRSLEEREIEHRSVESVDQVQREDAIPLRDGTPMDTDSTYDLSNVSDESPFPDAVRVAIHFMTDHNGAVCARLDLNDTLEDRTEVDPFKEVFESGKALVRGKIRATVDLEALFDARLVEGNVDPGTMYMPPSS